MDFLSSEVRAAVDDRDGQRCRWCGATNRGRDLHHIAYRRGSSYDVVTNLVSLCRACHSFVHGNPRRSGVTIDKHSAQAVLLWVIDHPATTGASVWRQWKRANRQF